MTFQTTWDRQGILIAYIAKCNQYSIETVSTVETNTLVLPHFITTPSNKKFPMVLLRLYANRVFKVYVKVRKSA